MRSLDFLLVFFRATLTCMVLCSRSCDLRPILVVRPWPARCFAAEAALRACWSGTLNFPCRYLAVEAAIWACCSGSFALPLRYFAFEAVLRACCWGSFPLPCWYRRFLARLRSFWSSSALIMNAEVTQHSENCKLEKAIWWAGGKRSVVGNEVHFYAALPALTWCTWSTGVYKHRTMVRGACQNLTPTTTKVVVVP